MIKCPKCSFTAEIMTYDPECPEFIYAKKIDEHTSIPINKCPNCGYEFE